MQAAVDRWSSPTTVYAGGLRQLPAALAGHAMLLVADERLADQTDALLARGPAAAVVWIASAGASEDDTAAAVADAVARHPNAVPVALGHAYGSPAPLRR